MSAADHPFLAAYDSQLRGAAETSGALAVRRLGPLWLITLAHGRGLVTYRDLAGADAGLLRCWVEEALRHFQADRHHAEVEWKTRGHDVAPELHDALVAQGFQAEEQESILVGEASKLVADVPLPEGVTLRRIDSGPDIERMCRMQAEVFGDPDATPMIQAVTARLARADGMSLWVAEAGGEVICTGRLVPVQGTDFAGIWGGATRPAWRGRGVYRALTSARAAAALALGKTLIHSDSTEFSRPILEASGLVKVSTTTPYHWVRPAR